MKARILVVEDDQIIQLDLRRQLQQLGYAVVGGASSGEEAITKTAQLEPDLVLMDIRLHGAVDGVEAARKIRSARDVPVIFVTAQATEELARHGYEIPEPRITKPFTTAVLLAAIERALDHGQS